MGTVLSANSEVELGIFHITLPLLFEDQNALLDFGFGCH